MRPVVTSEFWRERPVLVTGHTGFKGSWLVLWLQAMGARVTGLSASVPTTPSLYDQARAGEGLAADLRVDVRDYDAVNAALTEHRPEVVLHLAAQSLVRRSFVDPRTTYEVNVMGTVNVLEAVRATDSVRAVVNVSSDKCYDNQEQGRPFVEEDPKGGHDPYSNSKGCSELVSDSYTRSFFASNPTGARLGSARAGNVIGGGDYGEDRLIPDIMRGALAGAPIPVRSPEAVRPWQHVLNPLSGYLRLAEQLCASPDAMGGWNFGPEQADARPVQWIVDRLTELWTEELVWQVDPGPHPHEAHFLSLDSTKARDRLGWACSWDLDAALTSIVAWYEALQAGEDMRAVTLGQIESFAAAGAAV